MSSTAHLTRSLAASAAMALALCASGSALAGTGKTKKAAKTEPAAKPKAAVTAAVKAPLPAVAIPGTRLAAKTPKSIAKVRPSALDPRSLALPVRLTAPIKGKRLAARGPGAAVAPAGAGVPRAKLAEVMRRFAHEPTIGEVHERAMRYARVHPEILDSIYRRMHAAAILPRFRVKVDKDLERDEAYDFEAGAADRFGVDTDDDLETEFRAEWRLSDLVFTKEEVRMTRESGNLAELRADILDAVTKLYFERRRLQIELLLNPPVSIADAMNKELKLQELTAGIDALTGRWFSKALRKGAGKK
jgi:hypothetical protein